MASTTFDRYIRDGQFRLECAVCNRQVDEIHTMHDVRACAQLFLVRCHGQEQRVSLSDFDIMHAGPNGNDITIGRAFEFPALEQK